MSSYLSFQWPHPEHSNFLCYHRCFDKENTNILIALKVPWIQWPNHPLDDANSPWRTIRDKSLQAVQDWLYVFNEKVSGEVQHSHMRIACMVLMHGQLHLTADSLAKGEEHMKLFYGFAADAVAELIDMENSKLGKKRIKIIGSGKEAYPVMRKSRN
ncbi:Ff.00g102920.m01.CDS01 [Fusarium sp. VM40]|nr:Ff.00g102920.m01.CDS01 [Fusarium sp. VM40]